jgi:hypothetical protein
MISQFIADFVNAVGVEFILFIFAILLVFCIVLNFIEAFK